MSRAVLDWVRARSAPLAAGVILLAVWQGLLSAFDPDGFVLPPPTEIVAKLVENIDPILAGAANTGFVAVTGLVAGIVLGALAALAVTASRTAGEVVTPLAVAVNAIPIIALAPIFNAWFGLLSPRSNQMVVIVLVFFPVFINTARGLVQVDPAQVELMDSYAAGRWRVMRHVRIPNALPYLFAAMKLASSLAVIGAIVAEYFGGRQDVLGQLITQNAGLTRYAEAWAAVAAGAAMGGLFYTVIVVAERLLVPWETAGERH
jgi:NitT/TauT family transport system permease protein